MEDFLEGFKPDTKDALVRTIFTDAQTRLRKPTNLKALTSSIDQLDWFSAREVGRALALVAAGESYRQAASVARRAAGRSQKRLTGNGRRRDPNLDGQLVANWVDSLAPIVCAGELPGRWPDRLALDSREFRIDRGARAGESFHVFAAVGHDEPGRPRVWRLAAFPRRTEADWEQFLSLCAGTPRLVVTDFDKALVGAFPRAADRAAELRLCELHLRRRLENALAPLVDEPDHPVMRSFRHALFDHDNWSRFEAQAGAATSTVRCRCRR